MSPETQSLIAAFRQDGWNRFPARFQSKCAHCKRGIYVDDPIYWKAGQKKAYHAVCFSMAVWEMPPPEGVVVPKKKTIRDLLATPTALEKNLMKQCPRKLKI
jgi:hypothetical protein